MSIIIAIARHLGFFRQPMTQSWDFAGKSYQMAVFCLQLHNDINNVNEEMQNAHDPNEAGYDNVPDANGDNGNGDNENIAEADKWQPNCTVSKYFRLCLQKV